MVKTSSQRYSDETVLNWFQHCAELVKPNAHTFTETEQYLFNHYDALALTTDDFEMQNFKSSVLIQHFSNRLEHHHHNISFDMTDEEIEHCLLENQALCKEAMTVPTEKFSLHLHGYRLLDTERNTLLFESDRILWKKRTGKTMKKQQEKNGSVFWDETTGTFMGSGFGSSFLLRELGEFFGVTKEDIDGRTPRFQQYIFYMSEQGKLPTVKEFTEEMQDEV